jgi:hypothetical protein
MEALGHHAEGDAFVVKVAECDALLHAAAESAGEDGHNGRRRSLAMVANISNEDHRKKQEAQAQNSSSNKAEVKRREKERRQKKKKATDNRRGTWDDLFGAGARE